MSTLSRSESRRLYSWWWDSHISPKNSKWLQENLTDMDAKVKSMIKLIEEDADSFARRAEMYYKKRPELMKLVEEFYRAYRALAERYDHATVELRHAHRTMAEAFPNQIFGSSGCESGPQTPEMQHSVRALVDPDDFHKDALRLSSANRHTINDDGEYSDESNTGTRKGGLKIEGKLGKGIIPQKTAVCEIEKWDETEVQSLRKTLAEIQAEKDTAVLQYEQSLQKLSSLESELEDVEGLNERASRAEIEIKILKETLVKLEAERDAALIQYDKCLERTSDLENTIFRTQENAKGLDERATKAEIEAQNLKRILSELESEKETFFLQYRQCLEMVSVLESKIFLAEEKAKALNEQTERAENEIYLLKQALHKLHDEKEAAGLRYEKCMERLTTMENEVSRAQEDVTRLNSEILTGLANLKTAEKQCSLLERSNFSLRLEANDLVQEIAVKDQELSKKENELEKLQSSLKDEHSRYVQVEVTLQALQNVHSRCQEEQKCLAIELQNRLQMLQELEARNHDLWEDVELSKEEKRSLKEMNSSSIISITSMQKEILSLKEMKEKLENEAELRAAQCDSLQQEICHLNKDINDLNRRYQALMEQVNLIGLNPDCLASSIKDLQDDNLKLKEVCKNEEDEKEVLIEKNVTLERSLSQVRGELEGSREKVKELQDSCQFLQGEKSSLIAEKSILLSQLQTTTENMQKLLEKNAVLENSLSSARFELECLRIKSKGLEELCEILKSDKSYLQGERSGLIAQLENVEQRLGNLESMLTRLEEKYADLDKEKQSSLCQVKEIWGYLGGEKHDHTDYIHLSESRLSDLENRIHLLQQDRRLSKKEFEEELDNAVNSQVEIIILQNFMHDLEEKKLSLLIECQKQVEGSKLSNKLISELEIKNLEQLVEIECLLDEIENLRMGLHQVFMALQFDLVDDRKHGTEEEWITPSTILGNIEDIKTLHMKNLDEKHQLVVENLVLSTLLGQLGSEGAEMESEKKMLLQEVLTITDHCNFLQKDKHELLEINRQFGLGVNNSKKREEVLKAQLESQHVDMLCLQGSYVALEEESLKALEENRSLVQNYLDLQGELHILEIENHSILQKAEALDSLSLVLESFGTEKVEELKVHLEDINCLLMINNDLEKKIEMLGEKVDGQEVESQHLNETMEKLQQEVHEGKDLACQLHCQILIGNIFLRQKVMEFLEAEERLRAMYNMNAELMTINKALKRECEESKITQENLEKMVLELSKDCVNQKKVISRLNEANENLESEVGLLCNEVEERRTREESLTLELQEKSNEFGLWEAEASSFYFDLQMTSIREVLLENKVHELTAVCKSLKDENVAKDIEMEWMKERFHFLENEVRRFKAQLSAYVPTIAALRDDIESLEHNALHRRKHFAGTNKASMGREIMIQSDEMTCQELISDGSTLVVDGISDLMRMQTTIKAIEKALMEKTKRLQMQETLNMKQEAPSEGIERWRLRHSLNGENDNELAGSAKLHKHKSEISEVRHGTSMKDIPLDQASDSSLYKISKRRSAVAGSHRLKDAKLKSLDPSLELQFGREVSIDKREIPSNTIRDPNLEGANILERLASDAQKLMSLQTSVQVLKNEMEAKKRNKRAGVEYERLKRQLQEDEKMVAELIDTYDQLTKDIEGCPLSLEGNISVGSEEDGNDHGKRVTESAQKWFEKFGRLQLEVQSIQRVILKPDNEKKNKGNHKFPGRILLRDFIYRGRRNGGSRIRKKSRFCGCARPSTNEA